MEMRIMLHDQANNLHITASQIGVLAAILQAHVSINLPTDSSFDYMAVHGV